MNIRTLPGQEWNRYNKIKSRYKLTFDSLKVGGTTLRLLKMAYIKKFIDGKASFANVSEFLFWVKLWKTAMVLFYVVISLPEPKGKSVLELGAGDWARPVLPWQPPVLMRPFKV